MWTLDHRRMSAECIGFVIACSILIFVIVGGIFSNWYGVLDDRRPIPKPSRPPHPASIYYPPGETQPKVPGDPGWRRS
jgi:hypothetical protein